MKKIPTLFQRSEDRRHVVDVVTPGCEWVLAGDGVPTRKWDGTCVMFDGQEWWARREVKLGKPAPSRWQQITGLDPITGKWVGWEPAADSGFIKPLVEALADSGWAVGTYELCGPKINGNPEHLSEHTLLRHGSTELLNIAGPQTFASLFEYLNSRPMEGIVWWFNGEPAAKLKRKDFPR